MFDVTRLNFFEVLVARRASQLSLTMVKEIFLLSQLSPDVQLSELFDHDLLLVMYQTVKHTDVTDMIGHW